MPAVEVVGSSDAGGWPETMDETDSTDSVGSEDSVCGGTVLVSGATLLTGAEVVGFGGGILVLTPFCLTSTGVVVGVWAGVVVGVWAGVVVGVWGGATFPALVVGSEARATIGGDEEDAGGVDGGGGVVDVGLFKAFD
jgi:hypothetical protein